VRIDGKAVHIEAKRPDGSLIETVTLPAPAPAK